MDLNSHLHNIKNISNYNYKYVISEIGVNHNGDFDTAKRLVDASAAAGVDAVKFQLRYLDEIYTQGILDDPNSAEWNFEYLIPILESTHLSVGELKSLKTHAKRQGLDFIITPFDITSAKMCAKEIGVDAIKIGSMDMVNYDLILECSNYDLPMIISTGMWTEEEIREAVNRFNSIDIEYFLLLANSTYPTPFEAINLKFLDTLKEIHPLVGYSGHERGTFIPIAAAALGAHVIEKHITFDREQAGPDHKASMYPFEFTEMVTNLRNLEKSLGDKKVVNNAERLAKQTFVRAAYAKRDLEVGDVLEMKDLDFKAPGKGILRHEISKYIGEKLTYPVKEGEYLSKHVFEKVVPISEWSIPKFQKDWGVKCRFHDFEEYDQLNAPVIEFHMSQKDLDVDFKGGSEHTRLIAHCPEIFDRKLVDLCSDDDNHVKESLNIIQRSIDKTIEMGKRFVGKPKFVVHLGGMLLQEASDPYDRMMDRAIENFKQLDFDPKEIEIMPENLPPRPWYLGGQWFQYGFMRAEDMLWFCDHFDLTMTLDVCHAALYCNHEKINLDDYVSEVLRITSHIHISDATGIDGEGVQIGEGDMNFEILMNVISKKKDDYSWVTEIWSGHVNHGAGCRYAMHSLGKFNHII
jgi:sialic acid synthase SpsE/sugar phosphate isomerase/epimerase